jgi:ABC-type glutathione transport system ATPase component
MNGAPLLAFEHVSREFVTRRGRIRAVDDVSLDLAQGEILCLVGESGSGKTTMARMAAGLLKPTSGVMRYDGRDINTLSKAEFTTYRRAVQIVHQDPYASLNPIHTIGETIRAPLLHHRLVRGGTPQSR